MKTPKTIKAIHIKSNKKFETIKYSNVIEIINHESGIYWIIPDIDTGAKYNYCKLYLVNYELKSGVMVAQGKTQYEMGKNLKEFKKDQIKQFLQEEFVNKYKDPVKVSIQQLVGAI